MFHVRCAAGYSGSPVLFANSDELVYQCGNALVLHNISLGSQRLLKGTGFGIQVFTTSRKHGLIAVADKGQHPEIHIYSLNDLSKISSFKLNFQLGYTALSFSADGERLAVCGEEPDSYLCVYLWRKGEKLVQEKLPAAAHHVSFHPYDVDRVCATGGGSCMAFHVEKLWDKHDFVGTSVQLPGGHQPACHAWYPQGLYVGTATGAVFALEAETLQPVTIATSAGNVPACVSAHAQFGEPGMTYSSLPTESSVMDMLVAATTGAGPAAGSAPAEGGSSPAPAPEAAAVAAGSSSGLSAAAAATLDALVTGAAVGCMSLNRDLLAIACPSGSGLQLFTHARTGKQIQLWQQQELGPGGVISIDFGGADYNTVAVGALDGTIRVMEVSMETGQVQSTTLVESHVGAVTGMAPHPSGQAVVSCGTDGSLRVWDAASGQLITKRTFSSAQTCMAACSTRPIIALGSETGVLRLVSLADNASRPLQVTFRRRMQASPLVGVAFSPDGHMMATASRDGAIWFLLLNANGTATVLGQVTCPDTILCLVWPEVADAEESVLVSLASGGVLCASAPMELVAAGRPSSNGDLVLTSKEVTIKVVRVEAAQLSMVPIAGERYGDIYGMGADKHVHRIALPSEGQAWAGIKGRLHKSATKAYVHSRPEGCIAITPSHQLLVSGASDGTVATHNLALATLATLAGPGTGVPPGHGGSSGGAEGGAQMQPLASGAPGLHDATAGGVTAVSFDHTARYFVSAGTDGSLFVYETHGGGHITRATGAAGEPIMSGDASFVELDQDAYDEVSELTEVEAHKRRMLETAAARGRQDQERIASQLVRLKQQLLECIARNEVAPELEKVERADFVIDRGLVGELQGQANARVGAVQEEIRHDHLRLEVVAERLRQSCWESQAEAGQRITAMKSGTEVWNFALSPADARVRTLNKVAFLRRMQQVEQRQIAAQQRQQQQQQTTAAAAAGAGQGQAASADASAQAGAAGQPPAGGSAAPGAAQDAAAAAAPPASAATSTAGAVSTAVTPSAAASSLLSPLDDHDEVDEFAGPNVTTPAGLDSLLHPDAELTCATKKAQQLQFFKHKVYQLKLAFNEDWARLAASKRSDADRIADLNARIDETLADLQKFGVYPPNADELKFHAPFPEDMAAVMTVQDGEVPVERYVSDEERARGGGAGAGDSSRAGGKDSVAERALKQMMGGTLASRTNDETEYVLVRPEWMDGNPKLFSEEQLKELREFQAREKSLAEERAKRISVLEMELRTLRGTIDDVVAKYDDALAALLSRRHRAWGDVCALECRIIALASNVDECLALSDRAEKEAYAQLGTLKEQQGKVVAELGEIRSLVSSHTDRQVELLGEEKLLDRNFKKEFSETEAAYPKLLHLYRFRQHPPQQSPGGAHYSAGGAGGSSGHEDGGMRRLHSRQLSRANSRHSEHSIGSHATSRPDRDRHDPHHHPAVPASSGPTAMGPGSAGGPPTTPLTRAAHDPALQELQASTLEPFPQLAGAWPLDAEAAAQQVELQQAEEEALPDSHCPEGLDADWWNRFVQYRSQKVRIEGELRSIHNSLSVLRKDVDKLETEESRLNETSASVMSRIQSIRSGRKAALYDVELQLRLKAGQVEAEPLHGPVSSDMSHAVFLHRGVVEATNAGVLAKGAKKVEVLTAIKDFKKGIYQLEWEHSRCDMQIEDLKEKTRELQMLHVTRDIQAVFRDGEDRALNLNEAANLEALGKQRERLHKKALQDRGRQFRKLAQQIADKATQNAEVANHLVTLQKVLEEQERLREGMQSVDDAAARRMRSMVTHKKLKEIAIAQADEVRALAAELDRLRLRTYPTFVEPVVPPAFAQLPADTRASWPQR